MPHIETSDKNILKRYKKKHNAEELEGFEKTCSHCGQGKLYRRGRIWTPCPICRSVEKPKPVPQVVVRP